MRMNVKLEFSDKEREVIQQFCDQIEMPVQEFCKRAVFYSINQSWKRAQELQLNQQQQSQGESMGWDDRKFTLPNNVNQKEVLGNGHATSGVDSGDNGSGLPVGGDANTDTLADSSAVQDASTN